MVSRLRIGLLSLAIASGVVSPAVNAATVRLSFSGVSTNSWESFSSADPPSFVVGTTFSGYFDIDTNVPDSAAAPSFGQYGGAVVRARFVFGSNVFDLSPAAVQNELLISDATSGDRIDAVLNDTSAAQGDPALRWASQLDLASTSTTLWSADTIPTSLPSLALFNQVQIAQFRAYRSGSTVWAMDGRITSATLGSPVPLPAAAWLLLGGLASLVPTLRRRRLSGGA